MPPSWDQYERPALRVSELHHCHGEPNLQRAQLHRNATPIGNICRSSRCRSALVHGVDWHQAARNQEALAITATQESTLVQFERSSTLLLFFPDIFPIAPRRSRLYMSNCFLSVLDRRSCDQSADALSMAYARSIE